MKKVGILLVALILVVSCAVGCTKKEEKNMLEEITLTDYFELKDKKETTFLYIDSNDDISAKFKNSLNTILNKKNLKIKYLDTTKFKDEEESMKFMNADDKTKKSYEVPSLFYMKNGKFTALTSGYTKDSKISDFIEKYK